MNWRCIIKRLFIVWALSVFLTACSANHYAIHNKYKLDSDSSEAIAVDAKQRFLLSSLAKKETEAHTCDGCSSKTTEIFRRYCLEPSPDVFAVLSQSGSGSGSFGKSAESSSLNVALQAAFSSSETGSTISRTQTINMLKEMMYRTCERYLNGQISDLEFPVIAARDQRIMISILAIEQLTGTVQAKPTIIAAAGTASTGQDIADSVKSLDAAKKDFDAKKSTLATVQKEFDSVDNPKGSCAALIGKKAEEVVIDDDKAKLTVCSDKKAGVDAAESELKSSKAHYNALIGIVGKAGSSTATTNTQVLSTATTTEIDKQIELARLNTIEAVSNKITDIVGLSFDPGDENAFFCYRAMEKANLDPTILNACLENLKARVEADTSRILQRDAALTALTSYRRSSFEQFWERVKVDSNKADLEKVRKIIEESFLEAKTATPLKRKLQKMKETADKDELMEIFNTLEAPAIKRLVGK